MTAGSLLASGAAAFLALAIIYLVLRRPMPKRIEVAGITWYAACVAAHLGGLAWQ